ncbi:class I adenylate-forming enzyme family protein [Natronorubrum daqingense]|uniref:AMP-dependent synthetase n=1 Tax=Natronorubrum daqingense TaxID=588898 RepID=A0A1N7D3F1_9EURY|nr:AMP-binding protein [Natronorubrum daqingense]APX97186.1 AMP-dependent synthetase [Natronorubrum daqingense]SIR70244.1 fatty-acyl-CoA synthase/long-chain acyl-CoA synthetase [Natronorubrum daqingense]
MSGLTVGHVARRNARKFPDQEATIHRSDGRRVSSYTYEEFETRVNRVANGLSTLGVGAGDTVALYMKNNVETLECFVGAMLIGARPVAVNHRFKGSEVRYVLDDSDPTVAILDSFGAETISEIHDDPLVPVETFLSVGEQPPQFTTPYEQFLEDASDAAIDIVPDRRDQAALMYTSGTTGRPKGCRFTHDTLLSLATDGVYEGDHLEPGNRHLIVTPLFHVGAFVPFVTNLYVGGTTVVTDGFDPERVLQLLEDESINSSYFVPTQSRRLLSVDDVDAYDLSALESYGTGAAPSGAELKRDVMKTFGTDLVESFGQTEALATRLPPERTIEKADSVGRPSLNLEMKVVDDDGNRLPPGEVGRAAYSGPTVFDGYHNMPEKTDEVFDDGWFVSDDRIERDEEGFVYFVGRADDMIVSGGENVHPAEIEEVIYEHPAVDEVAVIGVPDETWGERIKAVVVPDADATELQAADIISHVEERIAGYKKPRAVEFRSELPRNPTGKVLKTELE